MNAFSLFGAVGIDTTVAARHRRPRESGPPSPSIALGRESCDGARPLTPCLRRLRLTNRRCTGGKRPTPRRSRVATPDPRGPSGSRCPRRGHGVPDRQPGRRSDPLVAGRPASPPHHPGLSQVAQGPDVAGVGLKAPPKDRIAAASAWADANAGKADKAVAGNAVGHRAPTAPGELPRFKLPGERASDAQVKTLFDALDQPDSSTGEPSSPGSHRPK